MNRANELIVGLVVVQHPSKRLARLDIGSNEQFYARSGFSNHLVIGAAGYYIPQKRRCLPSPLGKPLIATVLMLVDLSLNRAGNNKIDFVKTLPPLPTQLPERQTLDEQVGVGK